MEKAEIKRVLVLGGGAAGQRAAADLLDAGTEVTLVESGDTLGGTMLQLGTMFPQHNCLLCRGDEKHGKGCTRPTLSNNLLDYTKPDSLRIKTRSSVTSAERIGKAYSITVTTQPRFVDPEACILCGRCSGVCPQELKDSYQAGLEQRKAVYLPAERCVPESYAVEKGDYCSGCGKCEEICPTDAIDLSATAETETTLYDAVVLATGMQLYDPSLSTEYGYGRFPNVISGLEMERLTSPAGPGEGNPVRPSDGAVPEKVAWLQCIGSRDETHDFCSSFCCGYATKQAVLTKKLLPDSKMRIFMMDDRVFGRNFSRTYDPLRKENGIELEHCRVSILRQNDETKDLILQITDEDGTMREDTFGLVVLSIGGLGSWYRNGLREIFSLEPDPYGFIRTKTLSPVDTSQEGIFVAGSASGPADLSDSVTGGSAAAARVCSWLGITVPGETTGDSETAAEKSGDSEESPVRIGVFVCDCAGEIGDTVDLKSLAEKLGEDGAAELQVVPFGCLPAGLESINTAIRERGFTHTVIGACKRRTYAPLFEREISVPVSFVSLREECAYVHHDDHAGATGKALDLIRGAVRTIQARTAGGKENVAKSIRVLPMQEVLVLGGGLAGLTASLHIAQSGVPVHLVEKEEKLGGNALRLNTTPEGDDVPKVVEDMVKQADLHPLITVHTGSTVGRQVSSRGTITASIRSGGSGKEVLVHAGAEVLTTGGDEYRGEVFGLGQSDSVITLLDLGEKVRQDPDLPSQTGQVVFIGCVGPWNEKGSDKKWRCSRNCCETMVRQARMFREKNPGCRVTVAVREVNTYALREEEYTAARKAGVLFVRYDPGRPPKVFHNENGTVDRLMVCDTSLHEPLEFHPDLVVLAAAVMPREDAETFAGRIDVPLDGDEFFREWESKTRSWSALEPAVSVAGLAHGPKPVREVIAQSLAAAQNALAHVQQEIRLDLREKAHVSPGDCVSCLTCVRSCPYSVPRIGQEGYPQNGKQGTAFIDPFRCQGCGTCTAVCPAGAITLEKYNGSVMVDTGILGNGHGISADPGITVISCQYCGNIPVELSGTGRFQYPAGVKVVDVPCTGLITAKHILSALDQGADGVLVHACPKAPATI